MKLIVIVRVSLREVWKKPQSQIASLPTIMIVNTVVVLRTKSRLSTVINVKLELLM